MSLSAEEFMRYSEQIKLDEIGLSGQKKLKAARVLCVGLGGLGTPALLYLAAAGVGTLGLVDGDSLELSNLHRQILYRFAEIGSQKTKAASAALLALNPTIQLEVYAEKITAKNAKTLLSSYDIVIDGSDNFATRYLIHDVCFELEKPYVYASVSQFQGQCSLFYGSKGPCLHCLFPPLSGRVPNCKEAGVLGVVPGLLGVMQAAEAIKWLLKIGCTLEKRLLMVDILKMKFKEIHLVSNPDCSLCGREV
jgi:adenylyltransferase/sulfurtransferase